MDYKDSMIIYESTFTAMELILTDDTSWREAMTGLLRYGFYGEQPESGNPLVQAIWIQSLPVMKNAKDRYAKAVANGKKGGRPAQVTTEQIMRFKSEGKTNKEIAQLCGCSEKTVEGHITAYNKTKEEIKSEIESDTYIDTETYTESESESERFQGFLGCNDTEISLDVICAVIEMYKQGKNYNQMKDKIKKDFNQIITGKQLYDIIDKREQYENYIEKDKKNKSEIEHQKRLLSIQEEHDRELAKAGEVVQVLGQYGVNVTEEQVKKRYMKDMVDGDIGCWGWHMDNLIYQVKRWPTVYRGLSNVQALNEILKDIETSCIYQSDDHMESKVRKTLDKESKKEEINTFLDVFDEEEI